MSANRLKDRRIKLGLSLRDVEKITGGRISNAYLSQLENGKIANPSIGMVHELGAAYCVSVTTIAEWLGMETQTVSPPLCPTCGQAVLP